MTTQTVPVPVETGAWVRRFHPDGQDAAHRLICFPHAAARRPSISRSPGR